MKIYVQKSIRQQPLKLVRIFLALCWAVFIFILISEPLPAPKFYEFTLYDKAVHFILFGILAYLIIWAGRGFKKDSFKIIILFSLIISSSYAIFCEYYQAFAPGRTPSELDLLAGNLGIIFAIAFAYVMANQVRPRLLLHVCCAGCGVYISRLLEKNYKVTLYFYNSNIYPEDEYNKRLGEIKRLAGKFNLKLLIGKYDHPAWLKKIKGQEKDKERGKRCWICYEDRLKSAVRIAWEKKFNFFTTTLTISPHKDAQAISRIGKKLEKKYGLRFLDQNFKKQDGFKESARLSKELGLYRQSYCGCEFSCNVQHVTCSS